MEDEHPPAPPPQEQEGKEMDARLDSRAERTRARDDERLACEWEQTQGNRQERRQKQRHAGELRCNRRPTTRRNSSVDRRSMLIAPGVRCVSPLVIGYFYRCNI